MLSWISDSGVEIREGEVKDVPQDVEVPEVDLKRIDEAMQDTRYPAVPVTGMSSCLDMSSRREECTPEFGQTKALNSGVVRVYSPVLDGFIQVEQSLYRDVVFSLSRVDSQGFFWRLRVRLSSFFLHLARFFFPAL